MIAAVVLAAALSSSDARFVTAALNFDNGELSRAEVAVDSANVPQRAYAERVSADIGAANVQLIALDRRFGIALEHMPSPAVGAPSTPQPPSRTNAAKMHLLAGPLSPRRYFQTEIAEEESAVALFEREARGSSTPALRSFARTMLPTLRADLALAQRSLKEVPR